VDLVYREWMLFVDGENFTIRGQRLAQSKNHQLMEGPWYRRDCFMWIGVNASVPRIGAANRLREVALRAYYYTSLVGDESLIASVRQQIRTAGFSPEVFKRDANQTKAKGVDIALTKDMLSHAFRNNYDIAVLVAGDGDYLPVVEEVKRLGKLVYVWFFENEGLNPHLKLAADNFFDITNLVLSNWGVPG
jgi:uncharacterized LabA/DUF88 family protein